MCLYPKLIRNKRYLPNKKNGGHTPYCDDERKKAVAIGCGKCIECRKKRANEWRVRLMIELKNHPENAHFVTMTYSDESLSKFEQEEALNVASRSIELFRKRWYKKYKCGIKHFLISELGGNDSQRMHLHGILWTEKSKEEVEEVWSYGFVDYGEFVNERTVNYIIKYIFKIDEKHPDFVTKVWTSKGIGQGYAEGEGKCFNKFRGISTKDYYRMPSGAKVALPIYIRNKIFDENQREELWMQKLDQKKRYVCGEKIDISNGKGIQLYFKCLKYHQERTEALGYSSDVWIKKSYRKNLEKLNGINIFETQSKND